MDSSEITWYDANGKNPDWAKLDRFLAFKVDESADGIGVIVSTHDLSLARDVCSQACVLASRLVALGPTVEEARARAYEAVECISLEGAQYRTDIARTSSETKDTSVILS